MGTDPRDPAPGLCSDPEVRLCDAEPVSGVRVLIVEDEESIADPLADALRSEGFEVVWAERFNEGLDAFQKSRPDLLLLDIMLPDGDGRDLLREIRRTSMVPVIMLTAKGKETDKIVGLEIGADDYVVKPFSADELIARIRALLRRSAISAGPSASTLEVGDVQLDLDTRTVWRAGSPVDVTIKEFDLLHALMREAGRVIRRTALMDEVWDSSWYGSTKTLDVHISSIRRKLGDAPSSTYIHTVRGVGFRFASPRELGGGSA